jgi:hypothetical protein
MNKENIKELREKILKGLELSFSRLLIAKQKNDEEFVFSSEGKIIKVKARDIEK